MPDDYTPIDHGPRSNESDFGALDPLPDGMRPAPQRRAHAVGCGVLQAALPFTVRLVDSADLLARVQALRMQAYGHHLPGGQAAGFGQPDPLDRAADVSVFYAQDKPTGRLVGAARLQTNLTRPLQIERSLVLPPTHRGRVLSEVTRLVVLPGYAGPVKLALVKALHLFCIANQISGVVAAARRSLVRQYQYLGFSDLYGDDRLVPMAHGSGLEHRVLFRDTVTSEADSRARGHPDHGFVFRTFHPDIQVFESVLSQCSAALAREAAGYSNKAA